MLLAAVAFTLASAFIVVLPGPDALGVVRGMILAGRVRGLPTAAEAARQ